MNMKFTPNENALRVALIVFSVVFGILSVSLIALGVVYIDELWWPKKYVGLDFMELPTMLIVLGSLSLLMALAGCLCAKTYNRKYLLAFGGILFVILCIELTIAVIAFINFDEHDGGRTKTHHLMSKQYKSRNQEEQLFFQEIEDHYECCGITGNEDNCTSIITVEYDNGTTGASIEVYSTGCAEAVNDQIQTIAAEIGYFAVVLSLLRAAEIGYVYLIHSALKKYL